MHGQLVKTFITQKHKTHLNSFLVYRHNQILHCHLPWIKEKDHLVDVNFTNNGQNSLNVVTLMINKGRYFIYDYYVNHLSMLSPRVGACVCGWGGGGGGVRPIGIWHFYGSQRQIPHPQATTSKFHISDPMELQVLIIDRMKRIFNPSLSLYCDTRNAVPEDGITCRA